MSEQNKIAKKRISLLLVAALFALFCTSLASATIDLVTPANNTYSNKIVTFDYYVGLDNLTVTNCKLIIDSETKATNTNITNPGFNAFTENLTTGNHSWRIECYYNNNSESSEERTIIIDSLKPTIVLFFPINKTQINASSVDINFVVLDNIAENISCDITLNNNVNKSITAKNSEPATTTLSTLETGNYTWGITCYDYVNNSETSETRTFRIEALPAQPTFNITIPGIEYNIGDNILMTISAPQGTSIRVEVCPDKPGFVECKVPVNAQNVMNYPFQEYLMFTNYEGKYLLEAFFNYSGFTEAKALNYEIKNNIKIDIDTDDDQRRNVPVILKADAKGGVGTLNYTWHLSDGSVKNGKKTNITYTTAGNYVNTVSVKDAYNNTKNSSITITVDNTYYVKIVVKNSVTKGVISRATVDIDDEEKETDANGEIGYYLTPGQKGIFVLKENYTMYHSDLDITKDETITLFLEPVINQEPIITLIRPGNNSGITGTTTELAFKAEYNRTLNCSFYINEKNDGFFAYLGSIEVSDSAEHAFGVIELENKSYWWKVECVDKIGKSGMSTSWVFNVGSLAALPTPQTTEPQASSGNFKTYDDWVKEFQQILDNINALPKDEKEAAEALGISSIIDESISVFKNTIRDLDALNFRTDLTDADKQAEGEQMVLNAEQAYQKTPISIELLNKDAFVDYIKPDEIEALLDQYLEINNVSLSISKKELLKFINDLQQEVLISSKVKTARVTYRDGTQSDASIILREIKTYNITEGAFIMEIIPKDVAEKADNIMSSQKYEVVMQDPIIKFGLQGDTTITYYFEANQDLELLKKIKTVVLVDPASIEAKQKITGFSIKGLKMPSGKGIMFIPVIIILLGGLVFAGIKYDGINTARYLAYRIYGKKSLHYISVILNEINDNLDGGDHEKAIDLYNEAKDAYSELSTLAKNDVYENISQTAVRVKEYCDAMQAQGNIAELKVMVNNIQGLLNNGQLSASLEEYKRIEAAYTQLDDDTKELIHPTLVALGNKIQIAIENTKNLI